MNYSSYDVAVMNYPLFNKKLSTELLHTKLFSNPAVEQDNAIPVYIHIPFCDRLCDFCIYTRDLHKKNDSTVDAYVKALLMEIEQYGKHPYIQKKQIESIFLGGGTPSVLSEAQLSSILNALKLHLNTNECEITVECNPGSATPQKLSLLRNLGVTRVSTGIQSTDDKTRKAMNMRASGDAVIRWLEDARQYGFDEVSADLMYGLPGTSVQHILNDIKKVVQMGLSHISVYKTTVFAYTKLYEKIKSGTITLPDEEELAAMFLQAHDSLYENGYVIQSTQEYGRVGKSTRFWDLVYSGYGDNLSFGMSSFGYVNGYCYENETSVDRYIEKIRSNDLPIGRVSARITPEQQRERSLVMGLRKGSICKDLFFNRYGMSIEELFEDTICAQKRDGFLEESDTCYSLTPKGLYHQGWVSSQYMRSVFLNCSPLKKKWCIGAHEMP